MAMIVVNDFILILFLIVGWIEARRILDLSRTCRCWGRGHELHKPSCDRGRVHRPETGNPTHWMALSECGIGRLFWRDEVFTDTRIAYHNDPACSVPTRAGAGFVALTAVLISQFGSLQSRILRFFAKIFAPSFFSGNREAKFAKIFNFSLVRHRISNKKPPCGEA